MQKIELSLEAGEMVAYCGAQRVVIPQSLEGLRVLKRILSAEPHPVYDRKLGTESEPTQALVQAWLRADREANKLPGLELELEL